MAFNPITVNKGPSAEPHIYAEDDAAIFQSMFGEDGILDIGSKLKLTIQSNNLVRMSDGALCVGGHIGRIKYADYVDLTIDNGETGYNRNDLIIGSFSNTGEHTVDTFEPKVVKGTPATGTAVDPTLTKGSLYEGEHLRQAAVARVRLEGLNIVGVDTLLPVIPSIPSLKELIDELNGKMTGAFAASDIETAVASGVRGGWKRVGDIVFVDVKFNLVASYKDAVVMRNLPAPRSDRAVLAAANMSATRTAFGLVGTGGELAWHDSSQPATGNECSITGIYNCV